MCFSAGRKLTVSYKKQSFYYLHIIMGKKEEYVRSERLCFTRKKEIDDGQLAQRKVKDGRDSGREEMDWFGSIEVPKAISIAHRQSLNSSLAIVIVITNC